MRLKAKPDSNQEKIRSAIRSIGAVVIPCGQLANAFDMLVCYRGKTFIMEIKNPQYLPKVYDRERLIKALSDGERECMQRIESTGVKYHIICTIDEAIKLITS